MNINTNTFLDKQTKRKTKNERNIHITWSKLTFDTTIYIEYIWVVHNLGSCVLLPLMSSDYIFLPWIISTFQQQLII